MRLYNDLGVETLILLVLRTGIFKYSMTDNFNQNEKAITTFILDQLLTRIMELLVLQPKNIRKSITELPNKSTKYMFQICN